MSRQATQFVCEYKIDIGQTAPDGTPIKTDRFRVGLHGCRSIFLDPGLVTVELDAPRPMVLYLTSFGAAIFDEAIAQRALEERREAAHASRKASKTMG